MLVSQRGESACDRFTRGADGLADLLLRQLHLGRTGSGRLVFGGEFSEEVGNAARRVMDAELDAPAVSLAQATDQHPHELERRARMLSNEISKLLRGQGLHRQRLSGD